MISGLARLTVAFFTLLFAATCVAQSDPLAPKLPATKVPDYLASPRETVGTFLHGMNNTNIWHAADALDLSEISAFERPDRTPQLAFKLWAILNREAYIPIDDLSDASDAPPYVLSITSRTGTIVGKVRVAKCPDGAYRFTSDTIQNLDAIWNAVKDKPVIDGLSDPSLEKINPSRWLEKELSLSTKDKLLGMSTWKWIFLLILAIVGAVTSLIIRGAALIVARRIFRVNKTSEEFREIIRAARGLSIFLVAGLFSRNFSVLELRDSSFGIIGFVLRIISIVGATIFAFAIWDWIVEAYLTHQSPEVGHSKKLVTPVLSRLGRAFILVLGLLAVCRALGFQPTNIIATLGIGGLVIAFAAKDSIENVFGSIVVLIESPFSVGDWVQIGDINGRVEDIRLRSTRIRTFDDTVVIFPNSSLITKSVENFGMRRYRRLKTTIQLAPNTPAESVSKFTSQVRTFVSSYPHVTEERQLIHLNDFGANSLNILLDCYLVAVDSKAELQYREEILSAILAIASELGVKFSALTP